MPATASRAVLRQSQFLVRRTAVRHASSTSEKAGEAAQSAASKASDGLSRVSSAAGPALSGVAQSLRKVGGRTGKVISFVDCKPSLRSLLCVHSSLPIHFFLISSSTREQNIGVTNLFIGCVLCAVCYGPSPVCPFFPLFFSPSIIANHTVTEQP